MNCKDMKLMDGQNPRIRWGITVAIGESKSCNNNCRDCPNKQPLKTINEMSKVEK